MEINALMMDPADNVVTCVREIGAGETVVYRGKDGLCSLAAAEAIPNCHKISLVPLELGQEVVKYGEVIGKTTAPIGKGCWVSHNNIVGIPRDYESEFVDEGGEKQ